MKYLPFVSAALLLASACPAWALEPANLKADAQARAILNYLERLPRQADKRLLSGQFINFGPSAKLEICSEIHDKTGHWPAIIGLDYADFARGGLVYKTVNRLAVEYARQGGLITISAHLYNPANPNGGGLRDEGVDLQKLLSPGNDAHDRWMKELDTLAAGLKELQDAGVVVLWRPFHEMNGGWFWWGAKDPETFIRLWRHMFDYFTGTKGLNNLLWVYSPNHGDKTADYYAGDQYVDIVGLDAYTDFVDPQHIRGYDAVAELPKPFAFTEFGPHGPQDPPGDYDYLRFIGGVEKYFPKTTFFLAWNDKWSLARNRNVKQLLEHPWLVNREDLPEALAPQHASPYAQWKNGPPKDDSYFPIAVWDQEPSHAAEYRKAGINLYIGLWDGPTEAQLAELKKCGMPVICDQNAVGLAHKDDPIIVGWIRGDEPDNAQPLPAGGGYGPPILPAKIVEQYEAMRTADPSRPVLLWLGLGVAWDGWFGRGVRTNHPEDYAEYVKGCDIAAFDIYPVADPRPEFAGKLDFVGRGVERLVQWTDGRQPVWDSIECTRINSGARPTPKQVKAEVWISLVHGSRGIKYFCHEWKPKFNDHALLDDPDMLAAVTAINRQIRELAPALNSPTVKDALKVKSSNKDVPVATMVKKEGGAMYVFAVAMGPGETEAAFTLDGLPAGAQVEVLGEYRKVEPADGKFQDRFCDWDVHLYQIR